MCITKLRRMADGFYQLKISFRVGAVTSTKFRDLQVEALGR